MKVNNGNPNFRAACAIGANVEPERLSEIWQIACEKLGGASDAKARLQSALGQITPVRNEIAHVREVDPERLQRASLACGDVLRMISTGPRDPELPAA